VLDENQIIWAWNEPPYSDDNQLTALIARMLLGMLKDDDDDDDEEAADTHQFTNLAGFPNYITAVSFLNRFLLNSSFGYFSFVYHQQTPTPGIFQERWPAPETLDRDTKTHFLRLKPKFLERYCDLLSSALEELLEATTGTSTEAVAMKEIVEKYCTHLNDGIIDEIYYAMICTIDEGRLARLAKILKALVDMPELNPTLQLFQCERLDLYKSRLLLARERMLEKFDQLHRLAQDTPGRSDAADHPETRQETLDNFLATLAVPVALQDCFTDYFARSDISESAECLIKSKEEYQFLLSLNGAIRKLFAQGSNEYRLRRGPILDYELEQYENKAKSVLYFSPVPLTYRVQTKPVLKNPLYVTHIR
jgi:hypothetical protein